MRYLSLVIVLFVVSHAAADRAANGPDGVNATITGLTGANTPIGLVEDDRSGKAGYDSNSNSASNTNPSGVFFQTSGGQDSPNSHLLTASIPPYPHATTVANVMIGQNTSITGRTEVPDYGVYAGVSPGAFLVTTASGDFDQVNLVESINRTALMFSNGVQAINLSFMVPLSNFGPDTPNGHSYFTAFLDWSARQYDVLYVTSWGNKEEQDVIRAGADQFNGIVVGASEQPTGETVWRKFSDVNGTKEGMEGNSLDNTMHIDLLAPGKGIHLLETNDNARSDSQGTSYAAPLATGAVAILHEFIAQPHPGNFTNAKKHQVIKAVLMNSADKLAGVQGSTRTAIDKDGFNWTQTEGTSSQEALDDQLGTGLLNVQRAVAQMTPGKFGPGAPVPLIGWDYGVIPSTSQDIVYTLNAPVGGGVNDYLSVTLAYDRPVACTCFNTYTTGSQFILDPIPDVDLFVYDSNDNLVALDTDQFLTVEHVFSHLAASGNYKIILRRNVDTAEDTNYGLAWWFGASPLVAGDYNGDGKVDPADWVMWRKDPNGLGRGDDYALWRENLSDGASSSASLVSVPKPSTIVMALVCLLFVNLCTKQKPGAVLLAELPWVKELRFAIRRASNLTTI